MSNRYTFSPTFIRQYRVVGFLYGLLVATLMPVSAALMYPAVYTAGALTWEGQWFTNFLLGSMIIFLSYTTPTPWPQKELVLEEHQLTSNWWVGYFIWQTPDGGVVLPYHEIKKVELTRNRAGQLIHLLIQGPSYTLRLAGIGRFEELGQRLTQLAPAGVVTEKRVWVNQYSPLVLLLLPLVYGGITLIYLNPFLMLLPAAVVLSASLFLAVYQPLRHIFTLKTAAVDLAVTVLGLLFTAYLLFALFNTIRAQYPAASCILPLHWQDHIKCLAVYQIDGEDLSFSADGQNLLLNSPGYYQGVWVQPLEARWPYFEATFIPLSNAFTLQQKYLSFGNFVILPTQAPHHFLSYSGRENVLSTVNTVSGAVEQEVELPNRYWDKAEIHLVSPSGRYLFLSKRYLSHLDPPKPVLAQMEEEKLTILPELIKIQAAAFSADETTLYLLTPTELLHWDIASAAITHTTPRPVELQEETARCLVHLGDEQFLLTTGSIFWEWHLNQPPQERFTAGMGRDCPLFAGPDWVFVYDHLGFRGELYNLQSGELLWTAADFKIHQWAVSPDGRYLAGSDYSYTYLFDFELLRQTR